MKAKRLYDCGHVQNIEVSWIRANCLPEMKKDVYKVSLSLCEKSFNCSVWLQSWQRQVVSMSVHYVMLFLSSASLDIHVRIPEFLTCTEQLQEWNQPRPKRVVVIPVVELSSRKNKLLKKEGDAFPVLSCYDPRPVSMRSADPQLIETLRVHLLTVNPPCALLQLLVPPVHVALHDHQYDGSNKYESTAVTLRVRCQSVPPEELQNACLACFQTFLLKQSCKVTRLELTRLERDTTRYAVVCSSSTPSQNHTATRESRCFKTYQ